MLQQQLSIGAGPRRFTRAPGGDAAWPLHVNSLRRLVMSSTPGIFERPDPSNDAAAHARKASVDPTSDPRGKPQGIKSGDVEKRGEK